MNRLESFDSDDVNENKSEKPQMQDNISLNIESIDYEAEAEILESEAKQSINVIYPNEQIS